MDEENRGRLIAVEGIDGSGKSTQIDLLCKWLRSEGNKVFFSQWNSSELVRKTTKKGKRRHLLTPTTFSLIHATDFADRYERQIRPMLRAGYIVLCDRYVYTAFARDRTRGCAPEWLRELYRFAAPPDVTFYFHVPIEAALERLGTRGKDPNWFEAGMDLHLDPDIHKSFRLFQSRVMEEYVRMVDEFSLVRLDATRPIHDQQIEMRRIVSERLQLDHLPLQSPGPEVGQ